jgi:hypothetical protein
MNQVVRMHKPDAEVIRDNLVRLFGPFQETYPEGKIQIDAGDPRKETPWSWQYFNISDIDKAVEYAAEKNEQGFNLYVGVNPRRPNIFPGTAARDDDIEVSLYNFADLDTQEALDAAKDMPIQYTFAVTTGREPHKRVHFYWQLDMPQRNMKAWTDRQAGLADHFKGDRVIDPRRIMRLAGTVSHPPAHKVQRGYKTEFVTLGKEKRPDPVDVIDLANSFPSGGTVTEQSESSAFEFDSGISGLSVDAAIRDIRTGKDWHNNAIKVIAHWISRGWSDLEIRMAAQSWTLPGYTAESTDREITKAIDGARSKWAVGNPTHIIGEEEETPEERANRFVPIGMADIVTMPPVEYLIQDILPENALAVMYAPPASYKSFLALDMALHIAYGDDWNFRATNKGVVLYIAGEGYGGFGKRIRAWKKHYKKDTDAQFYAIGAAPNLMDEGDVNAVISAVEQCADVNDFSTSDIQLVIVDTVARSMLGDENSSQEMGKFIDGVDTIKRQFGCAALGVHHSGKDVERGARGSSALKGAVDTEISIAKTDEYMTLKIDKQKDGEDGLQLNFKAKQVLAGRDIEDGDIALEVEETSIVLSPIDAVDMPDKKAKKPGDAGQEILHSLDRVLALKGVEITPESGMLPVFAVTQENLVKDIYDVTRRYQDVTEKAYMTARKRLKDGGHIGFHGDWIWKLKT